MRIALIPFLLAGVVNAASATQTIYELTPADDWLSVINGEGLAPGDTVILHGGVYLTPDDVMLNIAHVGTAAQPITIKAAPGEVPVITRNTFGAFDDYFINLEHNVINMRGAQHVILSGLEITGGNWGIRIGSKTDGLWISSKQPMGLVERPAHHITIQNCHIHHTHNTALSANFPGDVYDTIIVRDNHFHHAGRWGESIYFGNFSQSNETWAIVKNSIIEGNYLHDNVEVNSWYQDPDGPYYHGTAIQLKDGCYNNLIRRNVMHYTFYPAILVSGAVSEFGDMSAPDWGPNIIERNVIWQVSQAPNDITGQGMQVAADAIVRNNLVYAPHPFYNADHQTLAGNMEIVNNTFISSTPDQIDTLQIASMPSAPILIANNALYRGPGGLPVISGSGSQSAMLTKIGNVAMTSLSANLIDAAGLDFFPTSSSALIGAGDMGSQAAVDFNGTSRAGDATAGAYAYSPTGNPGWTIGPGLTHAVGHIRNGTGFNPLGFAELSPSILGQAWQTAIDLGPGGTATSVLVFGLGGATSGSLLTGAVRGEVLVLPPYAVTFGAGGHANSIPDDASLAGLALSTQAIVLDATGARLQNAIDLVLGTY